MLALFKLAASQIVGKRLTWI